DRPGAVRALLAADAVREALDLLVVLRPAHEAGVVHEEDVFAVERAVGFVLADPPTLGRLPREQRGHSSVERLRDARIDTIGRGTLAERREVLIEQHDFPRRPFAGRTTHFMLRAVRA